MSYLFQRSLPLDPSKKWLYLVSFPSLFFSVPLMPFTASRSLWLYESTNKLYLFIAMKIMNIISPQISRSFSVNGGIFFLNMFTLLWMRKQKHRRHNCIPDEHYVQTLLTVSTNSIYQNLSYKFPNSVFFLGILISRSLSDAWLGKWIGTENSDIHYVEPISQKSWSKVLASSNFHIWQFRSKGDRRNKENQPCILWNRVSNRMVPG